MNKTLHKNEDNKFTDYKIKIKVMYILYIDLLYTSNNIKLLISLLHFATERKTKIEKSEAYKLKY